MNPVRNLEKKMDRCVRLLEELNSQMRELRRINLEQQRACAEMKMEAAAKPVQEVPKAEAPVEKPAAVIEKEVPVQEKKTPAPEFPEIEQPEKARGFNIDKHGRVYTEEEIESIIVD